MNANRTLGAAALLLCTTAVAANHKEPRRPNVLLILADDMGYSDIGCYGGEIDTPNLNALAQQGVRFTQFYNTARSCPSRASLLTGLHPAQTGVGHMTGRQFEGMSYQGYLCDNCVTIPEVLSAAGYTTWMSGKWHVGTQDSAIPENRGFQHMYGIHHWCDSYYRVLEDSEIYEDGQIVLYANDKDHLLKQADGRDWYTTDVFTDKAIEYIERSQQTPDQPFFLYAAYNAPHWPLEAHDDVVEKYLDKYDAGWKATIEARTERMKAMGILDPDLEIGWQEMVDWDKLGREAKENTLFRRAIYAAQVDILDRNIGRMVEKLKELGIYDDTIIIFLSDNGCSAEPENNNFGYRWKDNHKSNFEEWKYNSARMGASQGVMWAITSNAPFKMYKKFIHEGGISTPFIISWPARMKDGGRLVHTPCYLPDVMATMCDIADTKYPKTREGFDVPASCGRSVLPVVEGRRIRRHLIMYWEHEGHGGIRVWDWKLVTRDIGDDLSWELYNLKKDRAEVHDLSAKHPGLCKWMHKKWTTWALKTGALPKIPIKK